MATGPVTKIKTSSPTNIYSVLVIVATLFVLLGTVYLAWRNHELFGSWNPFRLTGTN